MPKWPMGKYDVGYGRPPSHTRFKPGVSGNPQGRPKGTKNLQTDVLEEIREKVTVREGEKAQAISKQRAVVKTVVMRALKGDAKAISTIVSLLLRFQESVSAEEPLRDLAAEDRALLDRFVGRATVASKPAAPRQARRGISRKRITARPSKRP